MKKVTFLIAMIAVAAWSFTSCKDDDDDTNTGIPGEITITEAIDGNVVQFHAEADNAIGYNWDLGNGETPSGQDVTGTYTMPGDYTIKCTATGRDGNTEAEKTITVTEGDPEVFSDINVLLSGYNFDTQENETTWIWATNEWGMSCGYMSSELDSALFDPIDETWWHGAGSDAAFDDEYQFKINSTMEYVNNFGESFLFNWMWANVYGYGNPGIWEDLAYDQYQAPSASWSVDFLENGSIVPRDSAEFTTVIGDTEYDGVLVIRLTNNAFLGMGAAGNDYQICSYINDTLLIRYDNTVPENIGDYYDQTELDDNGITPGEKEWDYIRLVKKAQ